MKPWKLTEMGEQQYKYFFLNLLHLCGTRKPGCSLRERGVPDVLYSLTPIMHHDFSHSCWRSRRYSMWRHINCAAKSTNGWHHYNSYMHYITCIIQQMHKRLIWSIFRQSSATLLFQPTTLSRGKFWFQFLFWFCSSSQWNMLPPGLPWRLSGWTVHGVFILQQRGSLMAPAPSSVILEVY